ncbi:MAG: menaquinol oxidoreductase [Deltaproteobacteria bacterium]|nr:menaquinol oxidoreductase [Deltaproteobacteria bacterium]
MLEKALTGGKIYWGWLSLLLVLMAVGGLCYWQQLTQGLTITGMSRDVSWGFYIAQFTFLVGVAASAVMLVIPKYLHHYQKFGKILILGEFNAVAMVILCLLFIVADLGSPQRLMNVILHPTPNSILFWDMVVLNGYLFINILVGWVTLQAERKEVAPPNWIKFFIYLSIPWAVSIHTVTAFLYAGLPGRGYWLTAVLAARFLASAFAAGPAFLILVTYIAKIFTKFDPGKDVLAVLGKTVVYAMSVNIFLFLCEVFTVTYSQIPSHMAHLQYLFFGYHGHGVLVPWMWTAMIMGLSGILILLVPKNRKSDNMLIIGCILVFIGAWIDKGLGMIGGGFVPNPLHEVTEYVPTALELGVSLGIYATGFLVLTVMYKVAIGVKQEVEA